MSLPVFLPRNAIARPSIRFSICGFFRGSMLALLLSLSFRDQECRDPPQCEWRFTPVKIQRRAPKGRMASLVRKFGPDCFGISCAWGRPGDEGVVCVSAFLPLRSFLPDR